MPLIDRIRETPEMADALERIRRSRQLLEDHLEQAEPFHGALRRQVMASVVHYSTKIEGNKLTREQVEAIIAGEAVEAPEKDRVEAIDYFQAMRWAQTRALDPEWRMSHETILTLHFLVGQNLGRDYTPLGRYRERQNTVSDRRSGAVIFWPPRPEEVRPLMQEFVEWCRRQENSGLDPYIVNALAHINFVAIHPFSDGNGRVARVICSLLMMRDGYRAQAFYSLEEYFGANWHEYAQQIERCLGPRWDPGRVDASSWVEWYLNAVARQVSDAEARIRRLIGTFDVIFAGFHVDEFSATRQAVAVWQVIEDGSVTNRSYRLAVGVSAKTASDELGALARAGYLDAVGRARGAHYLAGPKVRAWGELDRLIELLDTDGVEALMRHLSEPDGRLF